MKNSIILIVCLLGMQLQVKAQYQEVLFTVGKVQVTAEEFKAVYEKNKGVGNNVDPKNPEEYLELYVNFKLKIAEAYKQQRDTSSKFIEEFGGYRTQLAQPYLNDSGSEKRLVREAYNRMKEEVRASHIMYEMASSALPSDTIKVYKAMMQLRDRILNGTVSFENAARTKSADTWSAKRGGDLGYFTAFNMVYPFESGAFNQAVGEISKPIRSQYGYHLIKTTDRRQESGTVRVRQIFFAAGERADTEGKARAERSINEIHQRLANGENFLDLVTFSEDRKTKSRGGEMPEFGINKMMPAFENAAFELQQPGDYSGPIQTNIGWHVIQLIEKKSLPPFESLEKEIMAKIKRDNRSQLGAARFVKSLKTEYDFTIDERDYRKAVALVNQAGYAKGTWEAPKTRYDRVIATYADEELLLSELLEFWSKNQKSMQEASVVEYLRLLFDVYANDRIIGYEDNQLEIKYPEFRNLVREYREGILLFDLTQEVVWDKAAKDSLGIFNHYENMKFDFSWEDRIRYKLWVTSDEKIAKKIYKRVASNKIDKLKKLLAENEALTVAVSEGIAERNDEIVFNTIWENEQGVFGPKAVGEGFAVLQVFNFIPASPKELNEVKGLVIASYQNEIEQAWIKDLKEKYTESINKKVKDVLFLELAE
jgi:peptidyl-prolyl cis-trans isomerase SurA